MSESGVAAVMAFPAYSHRNATPRVAGGPAALPRPRARTTLLAKTGTEDTPMPAPLTRSLGSFAASLKYEMLPAKAIEAVRLGFSDCVAVMMAGGREPGLRLVTSTTVRTDPKGEARICLGRERASAIDAALANGVAGHALDYDDVALAGHPSTVLVPAILAEAEATGADGRAARSRPMSPATRPGRG